MTSDLQARLQAAVGATYQVEKELGGGGMSRVFLAEETELGRKVVIKVLPPEMGAGVNVDRFRREIQLAARLQHPHVVPLLTAGAQGDLLYYVMPFIKGESLRAKLAREGELPLGEAVRILRDVSDALAYAHREGVVHRDVKPDNVLISDNHAVVTDFGVAKAVSESTGGAHLTSLGVALGTPAYMAPEQAVADPHVDHRADIYAVGALAYEVLTGRPPFTGPTVQAVLAAHVTDAAEPVTRHREAVPPALNEVIMRCLAKKAADRWQKADDLRVQFESMATPSGGITPTATAPHQTYRDVPDARGGGRASPIRVAALFAASSLVVLLVVYVVVQVVGLPDWVFDGAMALLAIGLPIMLLTSWYERKRAAAVLTGAPLTTPVGLARHVTWNKALLGGGLAFGALTLLTTTYMAMRTFGIGPVGTLVASGVLDERDAVILASFENRTSDTTLGPTVTELFRVGLTQSPIIRLVDQTRVGAILGRMQHPASTRVDRALALEMAEREGLRAVIVGEVVPVGTGFALTAQMMSASGATLTAQQAAAADAGALFGAVQDLSEKIRERFGESLRTIRRTAPLDQVTTRSLGALRFFTQALAAENAGDEDRAVALLEEAIAADTAFAMAHRKLGVMLGNNFEQRNRATEALTKAYRHRDRLTEREAAYAAGIYFTRVTGERDKAIAAYRTLLERYPDDGIALNNTGVLYGNLGDYAAAGQYYARAMAVDSGVALYYGNLGFAYAMQGRWDDAVGIMNRLEARYPDNPRVLEARMNSAFARQRYDSSVTYAQRLREQQRGNLSYQAETSQRFADVAMIRGNVAQARPHFDDAQLARSRRGASGQRLEAALTWAMAELRIRGDRSRALRDVASALRETAVESLPALDRPYWFLTYVHALAGDAAGARRWADGFRRSGVAEVARDLQRDVDEAEGIAKVAEGRSEEGLATLHRTAAVDICQQCGLALLAWAYDVAGSADSSLAHWQRFADHNVHFAFLARSELPNAYRRLGERYEAKGDRDKALRYYGDFVDLWQGADPELQPVVSEVRQRMARLVGEGR